MPDVMPIVSSFLPLDQSHTCHLPRCQIQIASCSSWTRPRSWARQYWCQAPAMKLVWNKTATDEGHRDVQGKCCCMHSLALSLSTAVLCRDSLCVQPTTWSLGAYKRLMNVPS